MLGSRTRALARIAARAELTRQTAACAMNEGLATGVVHRPEFFIGNTGYLVGERGRYVTPAVLAAISGS